jgi:hypothetical protein
VNARREASAEPLDVIPTIAAASLCLDHENESGWDREGFCRSAPIAAEVERFRLNRAGARK